MAHRYLKYATLSLFALTQEIHRPFPSIKNTTQFNLQTCSAPAGCWASTSLTPPSCCTVLTAPSNSVSPLSLESLNANVCMSSARDVNAIEDGPVKVVVNIPVAAEEWRLSIKRDIIVTLILRYGKALDKLVECKKITCTSLRMWLSSLLTGAGGRKYIISCSVKYFGTSRTRAS